MINVYGVDAGDIAIHCCIDHESMACYEEIDHVCEVVAARSRGQARAFVYRKYGHELEFTSPMKIRLLAKDEQGIKPGILNQAPDFDHEQSDRFWYLFSVAFGDTTKTFEEWRRMLEGVDL